MTDFEVDPAELIAARARITSWHGDCADQFSRFGSAVGDSISSGWAGSSGQSMAKLASRWEREHQRLADRVHRHTEELRIAHETFVQVELENAEDLRPSASDRSLRLD
ncbi:WXG100 family type VII secretion target [Gordonia insulae]|uniref:WXG100 family type VII secretion target n=1 Tax=Gordonia insulae TaxID=2420509 RepID=A0A3G8JSM6_9ACTN|nr:WXG100 family type VII secretion target [Gordonia insulae]AZG47170.1 hypothetical protein D7316_03778 [Gordonia insulae]